MTFSEISSSPSSPINYRNNQHSPTRNSSVVSSSRHQCNLSHTSSSPSSPTSITCQVAAGFPQECSPQVEEGKNWSECSAKLLTWILFTRTAKMTMMRKNESLKRRRSMARCCSNRWHRRNKLDSHPYRPLINSLSNLRSSQCSNQVALERLLCPIRLSTRVGRLSILDSLRSQLLYSLLLPDFSLLSSRRLRYRKPVPSTLSTSRSPLI